MICLFSKIVIFKLSPWLVYFQFFVMSSRFHRQQDVIITDKDG